MSESDLDVALAAADAATEVISTGDASPTETEWKGEVDPVTTIDRQAEDAALSTIRRLRPDDSILSEESGGTGWNRGRVWIVDPLDGTVNFVHGIPQVAASVALWIDGVGEVGVVIDARTGERFAARRGHGATRDGLAMSCSAAERLGDSLVATGFPYDRQERADHYASVLGRVLARCRGIRRIGSAALDMCWVADGRFDGYWEEGLQPWDAAAGALVVQEAGGRVTGLDGSAHLLDGPGVIATNGRIHDELVEALGLDP